VNILRLFHAVVILLMFSPLLLPTVHSQSYSTITSQVTGIQVITSTTGSSVITTQSPPQQLFNSAFRINATTQISGCETFNLAFNATQGQYISGNFSSDVSLGFFITQDSSYQTWLKSGGCASFPSSIISQPPTNSYAFNLALPNSGLWDIVLVNYSTSRNADGFMTAYLEVLGSTLTEPLLTTITETNIVSSVVTLQTAPGNSGIAGFQPESIIIGIILGLAALILLRRKRR